MPVVQTAELSREAPLSPGQHHQVYCGLDSCVTLEIYESVLRQHQPPAIYDFERALQGPYLDMMQRGFLVDELTRRQVAAELEGRLEALRDSLDDLARAVWDLGLNPRSPKQLQEFFYSKLHLPEIWISQKGERKLSLNREVLEKLDQLYLFARPFVRHILAIRDLAKQHEVFTTEIDGDGRFRTSYNIAGTETGRPSSSSNAYGTGGNAQNIRPSLRYVFVADPGKKLCVIDLEQVEARDVGFFCGCLFDDWTFLDACESGDLHTANSRLIWPELGWTGDLKKDKELAGRLFYRDFTYRDMSKRGGHLSNYMGTAWTASRHLKVPLPMMEEFQARYCRGGTIGGRAVEPAYPAIPRYWQWIAQQLQTTYSLTTPFGRQRHFFGRPGDDTTLREAIAFVPQSTTADRMNLGLWRLWRHFGTRIELLAQTYDSVTFQYSEDEDEQALVTKALELIQIPLVAPNGRLYVVPGEAKTGWNWGAEVLPAEQEKARKQGKQVPRLNPGGIAKWTPGRADARKRAVGLARLMAPRP